MAQEKPVADTTEEMVFEEVETEATVDLVLWRKHLEANLISYLEEAARRKMKPGKYTINVRFLVEKDGRISNVVALNDPGYGLALGAVRVVRTGPKWKAGNKMAKKSVPITPNRSLSRSGNSSKTF